MGPEVSLQWLLVSDDNIWQFRGASGGPVVAQLEVTTEQAWRILSKRTRAIIGTPK